MADSANKLPLTGVAIPEVDMETVIISAEFPDCITYFDDYNKASRVAESISQHDVAKLYQSLAIICSFSPKYEDLAEPYGPFAIMFGKRAIIPDDLTEEDLVTVDKLFLKANDPALRARLGDILWVCKKDHKAAKQIVFEYIEASKRLLTINAWTRSTDLFLRALQIAIHLGRKNEEWKSAEANLLTALANPLAQSEQFYACHLLRIALQMQLGEPAKLAQIAQEQAQKAERENDFRRSREYTLLAAGFYRLCKKEPEEQSARIAAGETYIQQAEECLLRTPPSFLAASHFMAEGIEALRQAKAAPDRVRELRDRLADFQKRSLGEMKPYRMGMDLNEPAQMAIKYVSQGSFQEALRRLAFGPSLVSVKELRVLVLEQAKNYPMFHMFGQSTLDAAGRVVENTPGIIDLSGPTGEKALEAHMFRHAVQFFWNIRATGFIEPARIKIWQDHRPTLRDLFFLVRDNPFIPPGHEPIFARGLFYGIAGDMLIASHLLAPQIENSLRFVLEQNGVDVSNLESDLTQPVKTLGPLLTMPEMEKIFGPDICFELRGLLIEKTGCSFRHQIAHGFATEGDTYNIAAFNVWWLALRLCFIPLDFLEKRGRLAATGESADKTFFYFAYGSNMLSSRIRARAPSAKAVSIGVVNGFNLTFHKVSKDGSGKCDMEVSKNANDSVYGVIFEIEVADEAELDRYEGPGYTKKTVHVSTATGLKNASVYIAIKTDPKLVPFHWYKDFVVAGAREHSLPAHYIQKILETNAQDDPEVERRVENEQILKAFYSPQ
jgi:hypothetical protein